MNEQNMFDPIPRARLVELVRQAGFCATGEWLMDSFGKLVDLVQEETSRKFLESVPDLTEQITPQVQHEAWR